MGIRMVGPVEPVGPAQLEGGTKAFATKRLGGFSWLAGFVLVVSACGVGSGDGLAGACDGLDRIESGTLDLAGREGAIVHVPAGYNPDNAIPLVLVFHGGGDLPEDAEVQTGFSDLADEEGFLVVYPIARPLHPSGHRLWALSTARQPTATEGLHEAMPAWLTEGLAEGNADISYVEGLLDDLGRMFCVDQRRVYATGHSLGGGFASTLGCTLSDRLAAIGPVSVWTVKSLGDCVPSQPVPIMSFFSVDDPGYEGGRWGSTTVELWSFAEFADLWAELNDCSSDPEPGERSGGASSESWSGCSRPVIMWTLSDGGHTWPGGTEPFASSDVDASEVLWEFFKLHQLAS